MIRISSEQIKDARNLSRMTQDELSKAAGISFRQFQRIEADQSALEKAAYGAVVRIVEVLEERGIDFLPDGTVKKRPGGGGTTGGASMLGAGA
jgi:transcriptional regulator with XRE-family HTH domain